MGVTDQAGQLVASQKYWPYGATRTGGIDPNTQTDERYTGEQVEPGDAGLGLYNYEARFYSTSLGKFVSADPLAKDGLKPLQLRARLPHCCNLPNWAISLCRMRLVPTLQRTGRGSVAERRDPVLEKYGAQVSRRKSPVAESIGQMSAAATTA